MAETLAAGPVAEYRDAVDVERTGLSLSLTAEGAMADTGRGRTSRGDHALPEGRVADAGRRPVISSNSVCGVSGASRDLMGWEWIDSPEAEGRSGRGGELLVFGAWFWPSRPGASGPFLLGRPTRTPLRSSRSPAAFCAASRARVRGDSCRNGS